MKIRRIPETDLANICTLPADVQHRALRQLKAGWGPFSYDPTKQTTPDIFNAETELFGRAEPTAIERIQERIIALSSRGEEEANANLEVTRCLHEFAIEKSVRARRYYIPPYNLSSAVGIDYSFWLPLVLMIDDQLVIPFLDPRRAGGLTPNGRRFAFSMSHHRARALDPDLADATLAIFAFPVVSDANGVERRRLRTYLAGDDPLFTYDELDAMVAETYQLWLRVLAEREDEARRTAGAQRGSLL